MEQKQNDHRFDPFGSISQDDFRFDFYLFEMYLIDNDDGGGSQMEQYTERNENDREEEEEEEWKQNRLI